MTQPVIRVIDGWHMVGLTEDGRSWTPTGAMFREPRQAVDFADRLEAASRSALRSAPDTSDRSAVLDADPGLGVPPSTPAGAPPVPAGVPRSAVDVEPPGRVGEASAADRGVQGAGVSSPAAEPPSGGRGL